MLLPCPKGSRTDTAGLCSLHIRHGPRQRQVLGLQLSPIPWHASVLGGAGQPVRQLDQTPSSLLHAVSSAGGPAKCQAAPVCTSLATSSAGAKAGMSS